MRIFKRKTNLVVVELTTDDKDMAWLSDGSVYYWVRSDIGQICKSKWEEKVPHHHFRLSIGNVFRTREQAKQAITAQQKRIKAELEGK